MYSEESDSNFIIFIKYELLNDNTIQTTSTGDYEGEIILYRVELEKLWKSYTTFLNSNFVTELIGNNG